MARAWPGLARRVRDISRRAFYVDLAIAVVVLLLQTTLALTVTEAGGTTPDAVGWLLLTAAALPLPCRRRAPLVTLGLVLTVTVPYHAMGNVHVAGTAAALLALYTVAAAGPPLRTVICVTVVLSVVTVAMLLTPEHDAEVSGDILRSLGWVLVAPAFGEMVRVHRRYIAAVVERAERAERTREEEAARRVTEERLRIARDLHDLLAHSITLIGVQTSVAAHVLIADPDKLDRDTIAAALDGIADTCREARAELRTTLGVLRGDEQGAGDSLDPLPRLDGLPDLVRIARSAGAEVVLAVETAGTAGPAGNGGRLPVGAGDGSRLPVGPGGGPGLALGPGGGGGPGDGSGFGDGPGLGGGDTRTGSGTPDTVPAAGGTGSVTGTRTRAERVAVPAAVGAAAYRIVQESLTNAVRHAGPDVSIRVAAHIERTGPARALRITVTDSGPGPGAHPEPEAPAGGGFGIAGMRERARTVGGTLKAGARPGGGFMVTAVLPLDGRSRLEDPS
ncbi:sensor histidine kinase [Streptomyces pactum]|uniref:histidine kinase n=1 Tax=Streptomyces pactum TaxID=68249 RepID=A0ABS0NHW0_9ACTN|nr:histidine kinase [Streptomyces pactum]MBH5334769.1 sensor histidine kinase [Streptomyces pactum]